MASSPETAPTPPSNSDQSPPPPAAETPPPRPSSPPPAIANAPPPQSTLSPPPASPPPSSPSPPPPGDSPPSGAAPPAQSQSQSPPPNGSGSSPPRSTNSPPPARDSPPPSRAFSPPSPGNGDSESPPSSDSSNPPPPRSGGGSSDSGSSSNVPDTSSPSSDSLSSGVVAAIIVGGVVIIALLVVCVICTRRKKKRPNYYVDPGQTPKGGNQYYNGPPQWNSPKPIDHALKLHPPPGGWGTPPPPPPANNSGEYSSGYSGPRHAPMPPPSPNMGGFGSQSQFSYEDLAYATGGFAQENLLGQGGFGFVHKGILPGGREVAVKSLKSGSGQGEREFQAEVEIISRVHHRHLVSLVGYCIADGHTMLVYEFVPNNTLEFHLHGKGQPVMDWTTRLRIALGSAKGLAYLHEDCHPRIIHRDIKAANILIDNNFEAMVADFGLAKLTTDNNTHVSTRVMGTFGYLAPEYASSGKLSEKSDVFSFGVMLLELITGRRPVDPHNMMEDSLVDWARPLLTRAQEESIYDELVDPRLEDNFVPREMARMVACAAASIRHSARKRPKMKQIVRALEGDSSLDDLNEIGKPAQGIASNSKTNTEIYDTRAYDADMMKFRKMVMMTTTEFNSSEYGATSEYGLNPSSSSSDSKEMGTPTPDMKKP